MAAKRRPGERQRQEGQLRKGPRQRKGEKFEGPRLGPEGGLQSLEGVEGGPAKEVTAEGGETNSGGLASAVPSGPVVWTNTGIFRMLLGHCRSLSEIGRALAWVVFNVPQHGTEGEAVSALRMVVLGRLKVATAVHRPRGPRPRGLFPLPLGEVSHVQEEARQATAEDFCSPGRTKVTGDAAWKALNILALNGLAGYGRAGTRKAGTQMQQLAMKAMQNTCRHALREDLELERSSKAAEKELASNL